MCPIQGLLTSAGQLLTLVAVAAAAAAVAAAAVDSHMAGLAQRRFPAVVVSADVAVDVVPAAVVSAGAADVAAAAGVAVARCRRLRRRVAVAGAPETAVVGQRSSHRRSLSVVAVDGVEAAVVGAGPAVAIRD